MVSVTVTITGRDSGASTIQNGTRSVAYATGVKVSHAVVYVVTDAIGVDVSSATTAAFVEGIELVSIAVAVTRRNVIASTFVDRAWSITHATGILKQARSGCGVGEVAGAQVRAEVIVVANAIAVGVHTIGNTEEVDVIKSNAFVVCVGPQDHPELKGGSI